jgi:transposase
VGSIFYIDPSFSLRGTQSLPYPGDEKAAVAVAHSLLVVIYHVLSTGRPYMKLGVDYFNQLDSTRVQRHHVRRLEQLG